MLDLEPAGSAKAAKQATRTHEGGLRSYHSDKVLRASVAHAVAEAERRAKQRQLKAF